MFRHCKKLAGLLAVFIPVAAALPTGETGIDYFLNSDHSIGLTLNLEKRIKSFENLIPDSYIDIEYSGEGIIGSKIDSLPNHVDFDLCAVGRFPDWPFESWIFRVNVPRLGIEATQDFKRIDFAGKCQLALTHPYLLDFIYRSITGKPPVGASPLNITLGYAHVRNLEGEMTDGPAWDHRIDTDIFLSLPITDFFGLAFRGRAYNQLADVFTIDTWKGMVETVAKVKWNDVWIFVKYDYGGLPPNFNKVNYWSTGFGFAFE